MTESCWCISVLSQIRSKLLNKGFLITVNNRPGKTLNTGKIASGLAAIKHVSGYIKDLFWNNCTLTIDCCKPEHVCSEVFMTYVGLRCLCSCRHTALFPELFWRHCKVRNGFVACSFMMITLSRCSGQETSECNGSVGSSEYGFMKVQGWRKGSVTTDQRHQLIISEWLSKVTVFEQNNTHHFWQLLLTLRKL